MRYVAWVLFGITALILLASVPVSLSFWNVYGAPESVAEWWNQSWWVLGVAAVPGIAGYLILRISGDRRER